MVLGSSPRRPTISHELSRLTHFRLRAAPLPAPGLTSRVTGARSVRQYVGGELVSDRSFGFGRLTALRSTVATVPEPDGLVLLGATSLGLGWLRRRATA